MFASFAKLLAQFLVPEVVKLIEKELAQLEAKAGVPVAQAAEEAAVSGQ